MGNISYDVSQPLLLTATVCVLVGWAILLLRGAAFNALGLGDDVAASVGVRVHWLRVETFLVVGLMTTAAVTLAGPIGFVGLIVPHICRLIAGADHRRLVIFSGFVGAIFLMIADTLCRLAGEWLNKGLIPVGIVTAFCGGPFFIVLLRRRAKGTAE
jgi:iron complex transport system permease protein